MPAGAQSFDCRTARTTDEQTICQDPELARLDQQLATLYHRDIGNLAEEQREQFQRHETYFLNARRRCGENSHCLGASYRNRINELQGLLTNRESEGPSNAASAGEGEPDRHGERRRGQRQENTGAERRPEAGETATAVPRPEPRLTTTTTPERRPDA